VPLPFIFLAGAAKAAAHATTTLAAKAAAGFAKGAAAKGSAGKGSSAVRLPPGTTTVAKEVIKARLRNGDSNGDRGDNDSSDGGKGAR